MGAVQMKGTTVGKYTLDTPRQDEIDFNCAVLCESTEQCELWTTSTREPECTLLRASKKRGLLNEGIFGISGRSIANHMGRKFLGKMLNKMASYVCHKSSVDVSSLLASSVELVGSGELILDVPGDFFSAVSLGDIDSWVSKAFPVLKSTIRITAAHHGLQRLVDDLIEDISSEMGSGIADQVGTPIGFFLAGLISACVQDDGACLSPKAIIV